MPVFSLQSDVNIISVTVGHRSDQRPEHLTAVNFGGFSQAIYLNPLRNNGEYESIVQSNFDQDYLSPFTPSRL